ncbi:MAG: hypothetical protein AAFN08_16365, partial [Cyanobacteria bacterium J06559_3]
NLVLHTPLQCILTCLGLPRGTVPEVIAKSQFFPTLDLQVLAQYIRPKEQPQTIKAFLQVVRSSRP